MTGADKERRESFVSSFLLDCSPEAENWMEGWWERYVRSGTVRFARSNRKHTVNCYTFCNTHFNNIENNENRRGCMLACKPNEIVSFHSLPRCPKFHENVELHTFFATS